MTEVPADRRQPARRARVRRALWILGGGLVLLPWLVAGGCLLVFGWTMHVRPPAAAPRDPVPVFLLLDEMHRGLWLPEEAGTWVEYGFGEWDWYAQDRSAWWCAIPATLWPTTGTLSRRRRRARGEADLRQRFAWMEIVPILVERDRAGELRQRLERRFAAGGAVHYRADYGMDFVRDATSYSFARNCNDEVGDWLADLGCRVEGVPIAIGLDYVGSSER